MKKQKLNLHHLNITSFVTKATSSKLRAGNDPTAPATVVSCNFTCNYKECGTGPATINSCEPTNFYECGTAPAGN